MSTTLTRRQFIRSSATTAAGLYLAPKAFAGPVPKQRDAINVGLIGAGDQGQTLMDAVIKISKDRPIHLTAVCDIWPRIRRRTWKLLNGYRRYGHRGSADHAYSDYREMLDKETDLDAVIVATPDFWHARHAIAALQKGLHVYCEKEMAKTLSEAKHMVETARETGKLLQIGHQRRSNPKYRYVYENLIRKNHLLGKITTVNGQWNRSRNACEDKGWPQGWEIDTALLKQNGFDSMHQFRNWRWYKNLGGGPLVDLGSHQIDIYNWFLGTPPTSVMATGGIDYWTQHEWYDNVLANYEYHTSHGTVRATYRTGTTNSNGGYFEQFMGDLGTLDISEGPRGAIYREGWVNEEVWHPWERQRLIKREEGLDEAEEAKAALDIRQSIKPPKYDLLVDMAKHYHQPHLENFFETIWGHETLNCPAEVGYETAVTVLKVNEAVEARRCLQFRPEDFVV